MKFKIQENNLLKLPEEIFNIYKEGSMEVLPEFESLPERKRKYGREHPELGKFFYAMTKYYKPKTVLEIGSAAGASTIGFAKAMTESNKGIITCIDADTYKKGTYPKYCKANVLKTGFPEKDLTLINAESQVALHNLMGEDKTYDFIHIDGDHTYEGAYYDMCRTLSLVTPAISGRERFMFIHDVNNEKPWLIERTKQHPHPVYEAMINFIQLGNPGSWKWTILTDIANHLAVIKFNTI